ncbi:hypothetical protein [Actinocatenispora rupis]|uniref:Uncharacterized protein n=1 Tax=Actinocatenispora rupis TaxID=519421 RepID=A0A8J3JI06_9ACTN|nr:hypothetical protein [Actinocatenispora rupis]GID16243.1 hypothetical protein Aru02nite_71320 [Actinocatenispora rupis]
MASIQDVQAQLAAGKQSAQQALRALGTATAEVDKALQQISGAAQGTNHPKVQQSVAALTQARAKAQEMQQLLVAGHQAVTEYSGQL